MSLARPDVLSASSQRRRHPEFQLAGGRPGGRAEPALVAGRSRLWGPLSVRAPSPPHSRASARSGRPCGAASARAHGAKMREKDRTRAAAARVLGLQSTPPRGLPQSLLVPHPHLSLSRRGWARCVLRPWPAPGPREAAGQCAYRS